MGSTFLVAAAEVGVCHLNIPEILKEGDCIMEKVFCMLYDMELRRETQHENPSTCYCSCFFLISKEMGLHSRFSNVPLT